LRHAFGIFTWTAAALLGSLIGTAGADDGVGAPLAAGVPVTGKAATTVAATKEAATKEIVKKRRYVAALIDSARDDLELGRLDLAQAKAAAVRKIEAAYHFLDDRATHVLVQIDRLRHPQAASTPAPGTDEPLVVRGQSPSGPDSPSDFPPAVDNGKQDTSPGVPAASAPLAPKQQAKKLLAQARSAFDAGDYDEARAKALKADELDVKWDILEDQPQTLLSEIERSTGTKILPRKSQKQRANSTTTDPSHAQALQLIRLGRVDLQAGRFDAARKKALQAKQLNVVFGMFEDRPDTLLADVARAERAAPATASSDPFAPATKEADNSFGNSQKGTHNSAADAQRAQELLRLARLDLKAGKLEAARRKADQAGKFNIAYSPFDDRPELVLESIAIHEAQSGRSPGKEFGVEQAGAQSPPGALPDGSERVHQAFGQTPEASESASVRKAKKERAQALVRSARDDLKRGRIEAARHKAKEAASLDVTYSIMEDRPELILADIDRSEPATSVAGSGSPSGSDGVNVPPATEAAAANNGPPSLTMPSEPPAAPVTMTPPALSIPPTSLPTTTAPPAPPFKTADGGQQPQPLADGAASAPTNAPFAFQPATAAQANPAEAITGENPFSAGKPEQADVSVIRPSGASADDLFDQGMRQLRDGHTDAAYAAFLQCYHSGQQLDRVRQHQLRDFLRDLAPAHSRAVRQVSAEAPATSLGDPGHPRNTSRIEIADQQRALKFEKLRTEALNAHFKAERLRESEPDKALKILAAAIDNVEKSDLGTDAVAPLLHLLNRSKTEIEARQTQLAPVAAQQKHNHEIQRELDIDQQYKIRVEQEFADLVDEYNKLVKQDRWAEAELIAKQAKELDKENPYATIMFEKARIGRQVARNADLKIRKEDNFLEQLYEVEDAAASQMYGSPYKFPKDWNEITNRRKGKYGPDNKERTEPEKQIEQSLSRQISLHFNNEPLVKVIEEIQRIADVNVVLDNAGLEEERITSGTSVTIAVDGITLRSALNLILEPLNLGYMVHNEVLLITSRLKQQGKLEVRAYPVADLVLPIPNSTPASMMQPGTGPQWSVPSTPIPQPSSAGQAFMQVGQPLGANPSVAMTAGMNAARPANAMGQPDFDSIKHLIVATIEPESWDETGGPGSLHSFESTLSLVIRQTQKVHDEIRDLLQQLRRLQDLQVTVECRFITVDDDFFESVGVDFNFNVQPGNVPNSTLGLGQFGSPVFSSSSTSGSSTSGSSTSGSSTSGSSTSGSSTSGSSTSGTSSTSTSGVTSSGTPFLPFPFPLNLVNTGNWPSKGTIVGMQTETTFSPDLNVPFRQGSFDIGIPQFGGYNPDAGMQVGMAILSDIEAFFFIRAAQGDTRTNIMFAPKVTLFNGQVATMQDSVERPFVTSVTPTVGVFAVGFTPNITNIQEGVIMTVAAVVSADRRFVRLSVLPQFTEITDIFTFTFVSQPGGTAGAQGLGPGASGSSGTAGSSGFGGGLSGTGSAGISGTPSTSGSTSGSNLSVGNVTVQQPVVERIVVQTTVSVPDGGTVLLGGIKRLREGRNEAGVPILGQIPYLSRLFKNTGVGRETESLMLMVTPRIIIQEEEEELLESSAAQ
jgi:type II secretory pathway component GspD/PulD (secretin)